MDFPGKHCINFLNVSGLKIQNEVTPADITADISLTFRSNNQQEDSVRVSISLSQKNLVGENTWLRMTCKDQEEKLARPEGELNSTTIKASSKGVNVAKITNRMDTTKEKGVASDDAKKRVTKEHKFDDTNSIQILSKNPESCVINSGKTTLNFKLERGTRQGDPVSAHLFIIDLEVVFSLVKANPNIKGLYYLVIHNFLFCLCK